MPLAVTPHLAQTSPRRMKISLIVPTLNEEQRIDELLTALSIHAVDQLIVVDGDSQDATMSRARRRQPEFRGRLELLTARRGRASQMNHGASHARGDVVWFVHADTIPPSTAVAWIRRLMRNPDCVAGAFKTRTVVDADYQPETWWQQRARYWLRLADVRSRYTRLPYGDQAMFIRRSTFEAVSGFPDIPLMEDLELSRRLSKHGQIARADAEVRVSGRRFLSHPLLDTALVNVFPTLYRCGVPPHLLARFYRNIR